MNFDNLFEKINFLDNARWESKYNYNLINFFKNGLSNNEKLLTHWLCYITDRQMSFMRIWDIGGFIFSELVEAIKKTGNLDLLNPDKPDLSFFIERKQYNDKDRYGIEVGDFDKYLFVSHQTVNGNRKLLNYEFENDMMPCFISRYYRSD